MTNDVPLHPGKSMRSRRERICLCVVLGLYVAIAVVMVIFWRGTVGILQDVLKEWISFLREVRTSSKFPTPNMELWMDIAPFGMIVASTALAEQFAAHFFGRGWRISIRWLWSACVVQASAVLGWLGVLLGQFWNYIGARDWLIFIGPIGGIALTKLICAVLVLREKRAPPDAE